MVHYIRHKKWIGLIVYPFFLCLSLSLSGQSQKLNALLNMEFRPGNFPVQARNEAQLKDIYYDNLHDIFSLIFFESDSTFEALKEFEDLRIEAIEDYEAKTPWKGFLMAEIKLQWAFIKLKYGEEWGAFWSLRSANKTIKENTEDFPNFALNGRTSGMLSILFGVTPDNYQWIFNLFGMKGTVKEGIDQLRRNRSNSEIFGLESSIILGMVYSHLLENKAMSPQFIMEHPLGTNPLPQYFQGIILQKSHQASQARVLWQDEAISVPFKHYLIAESYFQEGRYDSAIVYFHQFLDAFKGLTYQKDAYLKIALSHKLQGKNNEYNDYLNMAKASKAESSEIDKNAQKIMDQLPTINLDMLQLRFAIDGGYFDRAQTLIGHLESSALSELEQVELTYRKARLNHVKGENSKAIDLYRQVTEQAETIEETYYAPNSFLQLGYLQRDAGDEEAASMYFERVLSFRKHPYKMSLDSKAKVALSLLDE